MPDRSTDAEVRQHGAQQLRKDFEAAKSATYIETIAMEPIDRALNAANQLLADFHGETEAKAIEAVAPEPPDLGLVGETNIPWSSVEGVDWTAERAAGYQIPATLTPGLSADEIVANAEERQQNHEEDRDA